jgi:Amt family ammonium transporter
MDSGNLAWVLVCAALVLFMTPGLAFFYGGMVRSKNVLNMLMMNFWCLLVIPVLWAVVGYSLAFSGDGAVIGNFDKAFMRGLDFGGMEPAVASSSWRRSPRSPPPSSRVRWPTA